MSNKSKLILIIVIILLAAASRLVKHPFNFTPIVAMSLFAGCYTRKYLYLLLPLAAMLVSDYFIGFYDWQVMGSVYVGIALAFFVGWQLKKFKKWYTIALSALMSSIIFFIVTNFAVWAFFDWYPHTYSGLLSCFTLALPFFRNSLMGDIVYTTALFGAFEMLLVYSKKRIQSVENIV